MHRSEAALAAGDLPERTAATVGLLFNSSQQGINLFAAALRDEGNRSHRMPCLLDETAFQSARETLLWARPGSPNINNNVAESH